MLLSSLGRLFQGRTLGPLLSISGLQTAEHRWPRDSGSGLLVVDPEWGQTQYSSPQRMVGRSNTDTIPTVRTAIERTKARYGVKLPALHSPLPETGHPERST